MNEFTLSSSISYVYGEDSSGNQVKISNSNMASGIYGNNKNNIYSADWDTLTESGLYIVGGATGANMPNTYNYGILEVNNINGTILQRYYPDSTGKNVCYRMKYGNNGTWRPWRYFAFVSV